MVLVMDSSGSMAEPGGGGETRMVKAKQALNDVMAAMPDDATVGLRAYGSVVESGSESCTDSELLVPVGPLDRAALTSAIGGLEPLGDTPIAYALQQAYNDLPSEGSRSILLVSDGEENCSGDPCQVAADLADAGVEFYVDVVGLQVDEAARDQLTCVAAKTGGTYFDVQDIDDLEKTLERSAQRAVRGYQPTGTPIQGGDSLETAAELTPGDWLDVIDGEAPKFYSLPDPNGGGWEFSVTTATDVSGPIGWDDFDLKLVDFNGESCVQASAAKNAAQLNSVPLSAGLLVGAEELADCAGPLALEVQLTADENYDRALELSFVETPPVGNLAELPAPVSRDHTTNIPEGMFDPSGEASPVVGGGDFRTAPTLSPGRYQDTILAGETLIYRIEDVGWGQTAGCEVVFAEDPDWDRSALNLELSLLSPLRLRDSAGISSQGTYQGDAETRAMVGNPVNYRDRELADTDLSSAVAGDYFCMISVEAASDNVELPITITTAITGEVSGAPEYVEVRESASPSQTTPPEEETEAPNSEESSESGSRSWLILGLVAVLVLGLGVAVGLLIRRN